VDQSAEKIAAARAWRQRRRRSRCRSLGRDESEGATWPVFVVVPHVDAHHALEMAAADDQDAVEAIDAQRTQRSA
jgi:hypothetical protein